MKPDDEIRDELLSLIAEMQYNAANRRDSSQINICLKTLVKCKPNANITILLSYVGL